MGRFITENDALYNPGAVGITGGTINGVTTNTAATDDSSGALANTAFVQATKRIITANDTDAALKITQEGAGNAILVEDVASDTSPFVVQSAGRVGVGTAAPGTKMVINQGGTEAPYVTTVDLLAVVSSGACAVQVTADRAEDAAIFFSDQDSRDVGGVIYRHATNRLDLYANGAGNLSVMSDGKVGINNVAPVAQVEIRTTGVTAPTYTNSVDRLAVATAADCAVQVSAANTGNSAVFFSDPDSRSVGGFIYRHASDRLDFYTGGVQRAAFNSSGHFYPLTDNAYSNGISGNRWSVIYAATGTINTSDENAKQDIAALTAAETAVAQELKGLIRTYRFKDSVAEKGAAARTHIGVIAQQVRDTFITHGLDPHKYALFCEDTWWELSVTEEVCGVEETRIEVLDAPQEGAVQRTRLGIRYDELFAFIISAL